MVRPTRAQAPPAQRTQSQGRDTWRAPAHSPPPCRARPDGAVQHQVTRGSWLYSGRVEEAGVSRKTALGLGIVVDHRRRNLSVEGKALNVERLKAYKERLVVFPRKASKPKRGDSSPGDLTAPTTRQTLPLPAAFVHEGPRRITQDEREFNAYKTLRNNRAEARFEGARKIRAAKKEEEEAAKKK